MALYVGLMSGTSLDGVDAALVRLEGREERPDEAGMAAFRTDRYEPAFRERLRRAVEDAGPGELCDLNFELGRRFARAAGRILDDAGVAPEEVEAVGSHGQTVWHDPPGRGRRESGPGAGSDAHAGTDADADADASSGGKAAGSTLQLGEPAVVAEVTGIPVVADFRVRDVAAGGQGAPLTPYFDRLLLGSRENARVIQNLGGMGNLTALPPEGAGVTPVAFDTGPGVALLDEAVRRLTGGRELMDEDGGRAAAGRVLPGALEEWLSDPFFASSPPRSTGRERFGPRRLASWLERHREARPEDLLATLTELTARSVAEGLRRVDFEVDEVYLCGGGARNSELARRLRERLAPLPVRPLSALGWDGDAREAAAFALLARQHLMGFAVDLGWATGAAGPRVLGKRVPA